MRRTLLLGLLAVVFIVNRRRRRGPADAVAGPGQPGAASHGTAGGLMPVGASAEVLDPSLVPLADEAIQSSELEAAESAEATAPRRSMLDDPLSWAVILFVALVVATLSIAFLLVSSGRIVLP